MGVGADEAGDRDAPRRGVRRRAPPHRVPEARPPPGRPRGARPGKHFYAVDVSFTLLLLLEVVSLILLRETFHGFKEFGEPIAWENVRAGLLPMVSDATGALAVFVLLCAFSRAQRHRPITSDSGEQRDFVAEKKAIGLLLLLALAVIAAIDAHRALAGLPTFSVFAGFYTVLVFSDVLIVLVSLRHSSTYAVFFRNSGFTVATVFIRLALAAAPPWNSALGAGSALFALALTHAYNRHLAGRSGDVPAAAPGA